MECPVVIRLSFSLVIPAAERSIQANLTDAREALINSAIDLLQTYKNLNPVECVKGLVTSKATVLIPLFISALLKHVSTILIV